MSVCTATADPDVGQRAASTCSTGGTLVHKHCKVVGSVASTASFRNVGDVLLLPRRFLDCCRCIRYVFVRKRTGGRRTRVSRSSLWGQKEQAAGPAATPLSALTVCMLTEFRALEMVGGKLLTKSFRFTISGTAVVNTPGGVSFSRGGVQEWRRG